MRIKLCLFFVDKRLFQCLILKFIFYFEFDLVMLKNKDNIEKSSVEFIGGGVGGVIGIIILVFVGIFFLR